MYPVNILYLFTFGLTIVRSEIISSDMDSSLCTLPKHPTNGRWSIGSDLNQITEEKVKNGTAIKVTCHSRYKLNGSSVLTCNSGQWSADVGQCLELCPPIVEHHSTKITCTTNGQNSDCKTPTNGTTALIKCSAFYESQEINRNPFRVCKNGRWNEEIPFCTAVCGIGPKTKNFTLENFYPWNVMIYHELKARCSGTLINEKTVVTSALCLVNQKSLAERGNCLLTEDLLVVAGKTVININEPNPEAQYTHVQDLFIPDTYEGITTLLYSDIAIIIVRTPFKITNLVQPVCVDWLNQYQEEFSYPKVSAKTAIHLPLRGQTKNLTNGFQTDVSIVDDFSCNQLLRSETFGVTKTNLVTSQSLFTTSDKYCIRNTNSFQPEECHHPLDAGLGLVTINPLNDKYYIIGVCSISHVTDIRCPVKLFTKISDYIDFISEKATLYSTIERVHYQTSCGTKSVEAQTLIVNGRTVTKGDYPWQLAIYKKSVTQNLLICGGSLINQRVILTAAHCVTNNNGEKLPKENYIVAAGKYYNKFDDPRDHNNSQFSELKEIILPPEYKGALQNHLGDIAILISETQFDISRDIQPVCIDWEAKYESQFLKQNVTGFVAGWGFTEENQSPSQELKDLEVPYIDPEQCKKELPKDYEIYLTSDKLCSGFLNKGKTVCQGDSGGGLVFKNPNDDRYYLAGVVSLSPQSPSGGCNSQQYALYTRVSRYTTNFIRETVTLYWS